MPSAELLSEAQRLMTICNACRYCEGFCAVFPAMELRTKFDAEDTVYLANLCHNCRGCYYACQYAPPHEFGVNVPQTLSALRLESYRDFAWPRVLAGLFRRNGLALGLISLASLGLIVALVLGWQDASVVFSSHTGPGAFYEVIPYRLMVVPALVLSGLIVLALGIGLARFWRAIGGRWRELADLPALARGRLGRPAADLSGRRRSRLQLPRRGFLAAQKMVASPHLLRVWARSSGYQHGRRLPPRFCLAGALPVYQPAGRAGHGRRAGAFGRPRRAAVAQVAQRPATGRRERLGHGCRLPGPAVSDQSERSGLLAARETAAMGSLLVIHLGFVAGLFVTFPYGKFVHAVYRYAALVRYAQEREREREREA